MGEPGTNEGTQRRCHPKLNSSAPQCSLHCYSQQPRRGSNLSVRRRRKWITKMWYVYMMEYYAAMKNDSIMPFAATHMDLEMSILSEVT